MKERPILFSAPMVRAIQADQKTQTRRAFNDRTTKLMRAAASIGEVSWFMDEGYLQENDLPYIQQFSPYGQPGDRLWVREAWMDLEGTGVEPTTGSRSRYAYRADTPAGSYGDETRKEYGLKWRPSIFMPRSACRILLEVVSVRVELLNDISESDCWAEGIEEVMHLFDDGSQAVMAKRLGACLEDAKPLYAQLWESINGANSWDKNPWVWVVEFKRIEPPKGKG